MLLTEVAISERKAGRKTSALMIALVVHVVILLVAALIVVMPRSKEEPEIVARVVAPVAQTEIQLEKRQVAKQAKEVSASAAASPIAKMIRANTTAQIAAPEVTKFSDGPIGLGEGDFGSGFGNAGGVGGMGSGTSFFGGKATGERFLFIIDNSQSMKLEQISLRNRELERSLRSLRGVQYHVILFAGPAWFAEEGWKANSDLHIVGKGKDYRFSSQKAEVDYEFIGTDAELPRTSWRNATPSNVQATIDYVKNSPKILGTDWELAFRIGHYMEPPPDVIFFMADGEGGNAPGPILALNRRRGKPKINTVAMQTDQGAEEFGAVAKGTGGDFTIVEKNGRAIDGFDFLRNPGKYDLE